MEAKRILIAMNSDASISKLKSILTENGYICIDQAKDGSECLRKLNALKPDLAILDFDLSSINGFEISKVAIEDDICDIILILNDMQRTFIHDLEPECGFMWMVKPLNKVGLINTIELMMKNKEKINRLEKQITDLKLTIDTRKEVEKAKGLLMKHLNLSEDEAFKRIQKQSMDKGMPMKDIAKAIILAYEI